jgi:ribonuclease P protein component
LEVGYAANVSPAQQAPDPNPWVSGAHGHAVGQGRVVAASEEGAQAADGADSRQARRLLTERRDLPRTRRLASSRAMRRVLEQGARRRLGHVDVIWTDNTLGHPRLGLIVPKYQSSAVARNRLRRRLREIWRVHLQPGHPARDVIIRARREAYTAPAGVLRAELLGWWSGGGAG